MLRARTRRPHDNYRYGGMTRSVKKLLQSQKTTADERSRLPMIVDGDTILWIPGFPVADAVIPTDPTHSIVLIYFHN
jgi:tRNA(Ile)-lysidine synthetase-like protein